MKKYIYGMLIALGLLIPVANLAIPATAGATDLFNGICTGKNDTSTDASSTDICKDKDASHDNTQNPIIHAIAIAINIIAFVVGIASVIVIMLSGFRMITSRGDAQGVANARSAIIYAIIGVVIALLAATIVAVVLNNL